MFEVHPLESSQPSEWSINSEEGYNNVIGNRNKYLIDVIRLFPHGKVDDTYFITSRENKILLVSM